MCVVAKTIQVNVTQGCAPSEGVVHALARAHFSLRPLPVFPRVATHAPSRQFEQFWSNRQGTGQQVHSGFYQPHFSLRFVASALLVQGGVRIAVCKLLVVFVCDCWFATYLPRAVMSLTCNSDEEGKYAGGRVAMLMMATGKQVLVEDVNSNLHEVGQVFRRRSRLAHFCSLGTAPQLPWRELLRNNAGM